VAAAVIPLLEMELSFFVAEKAHRLDKEGAREARKRLLKSVNRTLAILDGLPPNVLLGCGDEVTRVTAERWLRSFGKILQWQQTRGSEKRARPRDIPRRRLEHVVAVLLHDQGVVLTSGDNGTLAKTLRVVLAIADVLEGRPEAFHDGLTDTVKRVIGGLPDWLAYLENSALREGRKISQLP
jgi:hypothetical protein